MPWVPTTMFILVDSRLKNEVYMHYFFVRVWFVKIFSLSLRVDPRLKNEVYMHYFFGLSLVYVKITIVRACARQASRQHGQTVGLSL